MKKLFAIITVLLLSVLLLITASAAQGGDLDGNDSITKDDAIYLLMHTFFPEDYPIDDRNVDYNGDGNVTKDDAIYLLMYTFFPEDYPLCEHEPVIDKSVKPTCTEEGRTEGKHCAKCSCVFISQTKIDALGHTKGKWITEREPTEAEAGLKCIYCTVCGDKLNEKTFKYSQGLKYSVNNDGVSCTITGIGTCIDSELYIPNVINGYTVTSIGSAAFDGCTSITSVNIPDSVTSFGVSAFSNCKFLTSIDIPDSVTCINGYVFSGCTSLTSIDIPDSVTNIYTYAFYDCISLTSVEIGDGVTSIGNGAFSGCTSLESIEMPDSVTSIGNSAFRGCRSLASIEIPDSVTSIGNSAFDGCRSLASIEIPDSVTSIGDWAFDDCNRLTSIEIPDSVTSIGWAAFENCTSLKKVYITDLEAWMNIEFDNAYSNPCYYGAELYLNNELVTSVVVPNTINTIGNYAFYGCTSLTSIEIPDSVTSIGSGAFYYCSNLTSIEIPDSVTSIGISAFYGCTSLKKVYITDLEAWMNIEFGDADSNPCYYGAELYLNNELVTSVVVPNTINTIGYVFIGCTSLTSIEIPDSVTSIGNSAFYGCYKLVEVINRSSLNITKGSSDNGYVAYYALEVRKDGESKIVNKDNYLFYTDTSGNNYLLGYEGNYTKLVLPENYNGENYGIGNYAFSGCTSLTRIDIPDSVTSIGGYAFYGCTSLTSIKFNGTKAQWGNISKGADWAEYILARVVGCIDGYVAI